MAKDRVFHLPVLPLSTRDNATPAAGWAGRDGQDTLWFPVTSPGSH